MTTDTKQILTANLVALLNAHERAKSEVKPEDNPLANHDLKQLAHGSRKGADNLPAKHMSAAGDIGYQMEIEHTKVLREGRADTGARRKAVARARAARKVEFDKIANSEAKPNPERMEMAWLVVFHLMNEITRVANGKRRWAARLLGDVADDVAQDVRMDIARLLAKSDKDLMLLRKAAEQIADRDRKPDGRADLTDEERKQRKAEAKARKWLYQVINNRVHSVLVDTYFRSHNIKAVNIDIIASVMASISGVGDDPMASHFKAGRAPAFLGTKFQKPGSIDAGVLAAAINAAISERRLDRLAEVLLNEEYRRTNGSFAWSKHAEQVFLAAPHGDGPWMWETVCRSTEHLERPRKARGDAAREYVRSEFAWLPHFIVSAVEAFDPHLIGWASKSGSFVARNFEGDAVRVKRSVSDAQIHAILASDFELFYLKDEPDVRGLLVPKLIYADAADAASALLEHLGLLVTGEDLVMSVVNE